MNLTELLNQIKATIAENNSNLADNRLTELANRCQNISNSLTSISQSLEQIQNGTEVSPEDLQNALQTLNLPELTGESLKAKLEEILELATDGKQENQELADKISETEQELTAILTTLQTQQQTITNYQNQVTTLETRIRASEEQAIGLQIKAALLAATVTSSLGAIVIILAKWVRRIPN